MYSVTLIVVLGFIGVSFASRADRVCDRIGKVDCSKLPGRELCDNKGGKHHNRCAFAQAWCDDRSLRPRRCSDESTEESYRRPSRWMCDRIAPVNCTEAEHQDGVCDNEGGSHINRCALMQAMCKDKSLRPAMCREDYCEMMMEKNCTNARGKPVCDKNGGTHQNWCAFKQAQCEDETLEHTRCPKPDESYKIGKLICEKVAKMDCNKLPAKWICDSKGGKHRNKCAIVKAMCKDKTLKPAACKGVFCKKILAVDCSKKPTNEICDSKGGKHQNKCAFLQASCQDKGLKPAKCQDE